MERTDKQRATIENYYWSDYQPLLLKKTMADRCLKDNKIIRGLESVSGFQFISPDIQYDGSLNRLRASTSVKRCDILIGIFIQKEKESEFSKTLTSVIKNLGYFKQKNLTVVCVAIVDGIDSLDLSNNSENNVSMSTYRKYFEKEKIRERFNIDENRGTWISNSPEKNNEDEIAHIFMHKNWVMDGFADTPLDLIFCIKENGLGKLNSHLWLFGGFCYHIEPRYVFMLDAGVKPARDALYYLYIALRIDENLAGCTGELKPNTDTCTKIFRYAQRSEYKLIYMFDKALESVFGYISSIPSSFSAYRWSALKDHDMLLDSHFKSICHPESIHAANSNVYLSEDRLLSLSLFMKKDQRYTLRFVKRSKASINVPNKVYKIMVIRRRWINGTWFILKHSLIKCCSIVKTKHPC